MTAIACSPNLYAHAFRDEPAPTRVDLVVGGAPTWSATWAGRPLGSSNELAPEPEPELRPEQQMQEADPMATDDELSSLIMGEMEGMMEFLPELELGDESGEELVQPWAPTVPTQHAASAQEMDSPNVFRCESPGMVSPAATKAATKLAAQTPPEPQKQRKRVSFGTSNRVRTIPAVAYGKEIAFAFGVPPPDTDACLKENDGPSRSSAMMDLLLRAYFEHGATTTEYMQHVLGAENCAAITSCASELAGLCTHLADQIEAAPAGGQVGVLPSNSKLGAAHAPGIRTLAQWMWAC